MIFSFKGKEFDPRQNHLDLEKFTRNDLRYGSENLPVILVKLKPSDVRMHYTKHFLYTSPTKQLLLNFQTDTEKSRKKMTSKKNFRQKISTQIAPPLRHFFDDGVWKFFFGNLLFGSWLIIYIDCIQDRKSTINMRQLRFAITLSEIK